MRFFLSMMMRYLLDACGMTNGDHNIALLVARFDVAVRLCNLLKRIAAINDCPELPSLDKFPDKIQRFAFLNRHTRNDFPTTPDPTPEHEKLVDQTNGGQIAAIFGEYVLTAGK